MVRVASLEMMVYIDVSTIGESIDKDRGIFNGQTSLSQVLQVSQETSDSSSSHIVSSGVAGVLLDQV